VVFYFLIGIIGATCSYFFCHYKSRFYAGIDDTLDVFGCHGISGIWGGFATGLWASEAVNPSANMDGSHNGAFYGNGPLLGK